MKPTPFLFPAVLCAALLGTVTLVFAVASPRQAVERSDFVQVAAGDMHSVGLAADGTVWSWGRNDDGQLGDGTRVSHSQPVQVAGLADVTQVHAHRARSIAIQSDGSVWVWGRDGNDRYGDVQATPARIAVTEDVSPSALMAP